MMQPEQTCPAPLLPRRHYEPPTKGRYNRRRIDRWKCATAPATAFRRWNVSRRRAVTVA
jgi:hypothetical protein